MKTKIISFFMLLALFLGLFPATSFAATETVTVTVANRTVCAHMQIPIFDLDADGQTTINDALIGIHQEAFSGGAQEGYAYYEGAYGLAISKLWGIDNGGAYGYYLNNASAMSLSDPIKHGDQVYAFVYTDLDLWSDTYCYFSPAAADAKVGTPIELTLTALSYDENFNTVALPLAGARITVDGEETELVTDENGRVTFTPSKEGSMMISAVSSTVTLTPPVCILNASLDAAPTGDAMTAYLIVGAIALIGILLLLFLLPRNKRK